MSTYIVIPRQQAAEVIRSMEAGDLPGLLNASLSQAQHLLQGTSLQDSRLLVNSELFEPNGVRIASGNEAQAIGRASNLPRVLAGAGVVLVDDPGAEILTRLNVDADIIENFEIPIVEPVMTQAVASCTPWHLGKVNVTAARAKGLNGKGVRIGVLDTGIDATHPEFLGKSISFAEFDSKGFLISTAARDSGVHGTHVSALAAGSSCGIAPAAELAVAAVLTTSTAVGNSGFLAQILGGLNWIAQSNHGVPGAPISQCPILNASLGASGYNPYLLSSLQIIRQAPAALMSAAIGNAGTLGVNKHSSPGNYDIVVGVGATDRADTAAAFSDWGLEPMSGARKPDLSAPGVDICSAIPGGGMGLMSGTSMAAPLIAGAAALLIQQTPALARNPAGLFLQLMAIVDPTPAAIPANIASGYNRIGRGRLDLTYI